MIKKIKEFLFGSSVDNEVEALNNSIANLAIAYQEANLGIEEAKECFEATKKMIVADFTELKKDTLEKTQNAVAGLNFKIQTEKEEVTDKYENAMGKIANKEVLVNSLTNTLKTLELNNFEL